MPKKTYHFKVIEYKFNKCVEALEYLFNCKKKDIINLKSREKNFVAARRYLIHYLYNSCNIPHSHMNKFINGIHHATSIHHCRKLQDLLDIYPSERKIYNEFKMVAGDFEDTKVQLEIMINEIDDIKNDINKLLNNLKDA